jgi:hypothetical protein
LLYRAKNQSNDRNLLLFFRSAALISHITVLCSSGENHLQNDRICHGLRRGRIRIRDCYTRVRCASIEHITHTTNILGYLLNSKYKKSDSLRHVFRKSPVKNINRKVFSIYCMNIFGEPLQFLKL